MKKIGLIPRLILALIIGTLIGLYAPSWAIRLTETARILLGNLIKYFIPLIMIFFVAAGIAEFGKDSSRILAYTVGISYISTILACLFGAIVAYILVPIFSVESGGIVAAIDIGAPFVEINMPPIMDIMSALLLAFTFGIGISVTNNKPLRDIILGGRDIISLVIKKVITPLVPFFIASVFSGLAAKGEVFATAALFGKMLILIIVLHFIWLFIQYAVAGFYSKNDPVVAFKTMFPAYLTAMGTMSSAATMPVSLAQAKKIPNMKSEIADFVMPLCSTVHLSGAAMTITISAITVMFLTTGTLPPIGSMITFIFLLGIIEVGAVGVPGGSIMAALGILSSSLGFGEEALALMLTIFMIQDSFGTATNIVGDGAIALIINKRFGSESKKAS